MGPSIDIDLLVMRGVGLRKTVCARAKRALSTAAMEEEQALAARRMSLLVDGNNALYHFFDPLSTAEVDGVKTSAVDGLLRLLRRMNATHQPEHISVVFDSKLRPTTRRILQPTYKKDRAPTPQALAPQFAYAKRLLREAQVNCIELPGFEADDIIASYAKQYVAAGFDVLLISNDNDFLQLVHDSSDEGDGENSVYNGQDMSYGSVKLYQPSKRKYVRERNLRGRFGLHPSLLPDFYALCGHQWKKLPRVENVTDEVAVELLTQFGGLFPLLRQLNTLEDAKLRQTLMQRISSVESSYRMVKLDGSIALPIPIEALERPLLSSK